MKAAAHAGRSERADVMKADDLESLLGEHLLADARLAAHFVALAEAAGLTAREINRRLHSVAEETDSSSGSRTRRALPTCAAHGT